MKLLTILKYIVDKLEYKDYSKKYKTIITNSNKKLKHHVKLTKAQKREVQSYYMGMIGEKIPLYSHEYFYSRTGFFTKDYVPLNLYHCEIIRKANYYPDMPFYSDKNNQELLIGKENIAKIILKNMNGYYYYNDKPVSIQEAISLCSNMEPSIIKPSLKSKGKGVQIISVKDGVTNIDGLTIEQIFKAYSKNFVIQECIKQHERMAALNPTSVNTLRILTYRSNMEVLIVYAVIRIGRKGKVVDNQSSGGISTKINNDGTLDRVAYGGYLEDDIYKTDSGITLDGYKIPSYDKAIELVKNLHMKLPFANLVGWDIAIRDNGEPVLIEFNTNTGLSQTAFKSGMGENTERIIRELWPRPNTKFHKVGFKK